jgi:nucleoside-diphosphate-sugar epimerase
MKLLVTGANGFVGSALCAHLAQQGHDVAALMRSSAQQLLSKVEQTNKEISRPSLVFGDFFDMPAMQRLLQGTQALVHSAARVHQVRESVADPLAAYRAINTDGTLKLAQAAALAGVRRFVFLSSVKVNGEFTAPGQPFVASQAAPQDAYGISKWEAELGLHRIAQETGLEVVIIRPPLVYGPGVKANFLSMMRWLQRGIPLPLGAIHNQRSLVALPNLLNLIETCLTHPAAAGQTFMASDQRDLSTTQLLRLLGDALGKPARLLPIPQSMLEGSLKLIGKAGIAQRLCGSLAVDAEPATQLLGWKPVVTVEQGLQATAEHFLAAQ